MDIGIVSLPRHPPAAQLSVNGPTVDSTSIGVIVVPGRTSLLVVHQVFVVSAIRYTVKPQICE